MRDAAPLSPLASPLIIIAVPLLCRYVWRHCCGGDYNYFFGGSGSSRRGKKEGFSPVIITIAMKGLEGTNQARGLPYTTSTKFCFVYPLPPSVRKNLNTDQTFSHQPHLK